MQSESDEKRGNDDGRSTRSADTVDTHATRSAMAFRSSFVPSFRHSTITWFLALDALHPPIWNFFFPLQLLESTKLVLGFDGANKCAESSFRQRVTLGIGLGSEVQTPLASCTLGDHRTELSALKNRKRVVA